ncbi:uncharacterized protein LOC111290002 isoform X2 [Durio zibethinus]|uniref:Uncharacterized protein LOC111290002 isoform X2 n=1 Tax=Durio zibethinus TaxID=66656 RepID=A0A6P5Y9G4_DURZI|nr:uncharacterized protein LOC111290002 isoform X2 [Durio zibethinus]
METPEPKSHSWGSSPMPPSSSARLWRPAAQRNLRNQWSKMASYRQQWLSSSSSARTHATSLVNAYLSQKYMPLMELGALKDMPDIRKKASLKLFKQQELHRSKLLSSYKDMVAVVVQMVNASKSMRCFLKGASSSSLVQFSSSSEDINETGDCGGVAVFGFWSISSFEKLAEELIQMFKLELSLKRLLLLDLLSIGCEVLHTNQLCWSNEIYHGEFGDLKVCNLYSEETSEPVHPRLKDRKSEIPAFQCNHQPDQEILQFSLQVYITTWLAEVNIDGHRVDEIFAEIGEEMHVSLS